MSKETVLRSIALILALFGLFILWQSTVWGLKTAPWMIAQLGSLSGDLQHQIVYEGPVTALQITGAVFLWVGLWRVLEPTKNKNS
jgi:hypothetical protein